MIRARAASRCVLVGARTHEDSSVASSGVSSSASGGRPRRAEEPTSANYRTGVSAKCTAFFHRHERIGPLVANEHGPESVLRINVLAQALSPRFEASGDI